MMNGLLPTWCLQTTHWKHLSCHFLLLYSIFFMPGRKVSPQASHREANSAS